MLKFVFLSSDFYEDHIEDKEIEQKASRPYAQVHIVVNGVLWCIPLRSNINHKYAIWTDKENHCGLDLSKAVVITDPERHIDTSLQPHIRDNEFKQLKKISEYWVAKKLLGYIEEYKEAKQHPDTKHNQILKYSTLQYFETYI